MSARALPAAARLARGCIAGVSNRAECDTAPVRAARGARARCAPAAGTTATATEACVHPCAPAGACAWRGGRAPQPRPNCAAAGGARTHAGPRAGGSYKEPGELKISMLEGRVDKDKHKDKDEDSSDEEEDFARSVKTKAKKPRRASGGSVASPAPRAQGAKAARHSINGSESLFGACIPSVPAPVPSVVSSKRARGRAAFAAPCAPSSVPASAASRDASAQASCLQEGTLGRGLFGSAALTAGALPLNALPRSPALFDAAGRRAAEIITHKPSAIPMAVKQWWSDYDKHPADAVAKLTNMMIEVLCALFPWRPCGVVAHARALIISMSSRALPATGMRSPESTSARGLQVCARRETCSWISLSWFSGQPVEQPHAAMSLFLSLPVCVANVRDRSEQ